MTREDFLKALQRELSFLPLADQKDILGDYIAHFSAGIADGKTEAQIAEELGSVSEIAESCRETFLGKASAATKPNNDEKLLNSILESDFSASSSDTNANMRADTINKQKPENTRTLNLNEMNFDPQTGKPINGNAVAAKTNNNTNSAVVKKEKKMSVPGLIGYNIGIIIAAVVLFALIVAGIATTICGMASSVILIFTSADFFTSAGFVFGNVVLGVGLSLLFLWAFYGLIKGMIGVGKMVVKAIKTDCAFIIGGNI